MNILVTGGAGFIGSHIVDRLVRGGHAVRVVDCLLPAAHQATPSYLNDDAEYIWGDLRDEAVSGRAVRDIDAVCHQASMVGLGKDFRDVSAYVQHNDVATASLLTALFVRRQEARLVLASSMVIYGEGAYSCAVHGTVRPPPRSESALRHGDFEPKCPHCQGELTAQSIAETTPPDPRSVYAATKLHQEHLMQAYAAETGASLARLRYHNVYGDRMPAETPYAGVAAIFRSALERGEAPQVFEDGRQLRDFVHVKDVARANELAATSGATGAYNVCTGAPRSIIDMAAALGRSFGASEEPSITGAFRGGDVRHVFGSPNRASEGLGFRAEISFEDGMARFAHARSRQPS